jgi:hypothetical protein
VGKPDKTLPLIHLKEAHSLDMQAHFAFYSGDPAIAKMLLEAVCIDSMPDYQHIVSDIRKQCQLTGTLSGNIRFVVL